MGIESDKLVFDYLSKVGDLAQQQQLPSGTRMRLVNDLRGEIERRRAKATTADTPAAVRRILARLGTPHDVVAAAGAGTAGRARKPAGPPHGASAPAAPAAPATPVAPVAPAPEAMGTPDAAGTPDDATAPGPAHRAPTTARRASDPDPGPGPGPGEPPDTAGRLNGADSPHGTGSPRGAEPRQGAGGPRAPWSKVLRAKPSLRKVPRPRPGEAPPDAQPGAGPTGRRPAAPPPTAKAPAPPHLAPTSELGDPAAQPDWWRIDGAPLGGMDIAPGFTGGVEIPEILRPPTPEEKTAGKDAGTDTPAGPAAAGAKDGAAPAVAGAPAPRLRGLRRLLRRRTAPQSAAAAPARRPRLSWSNPLLLLAAAALVAGAVLGSWLALAFGWVIAYASRRLTTAEIKWAVMGLPGLAVTAGIVWLWGRRDGRWGDPLPQAHMSDAIAQTWPWVVRGAALASAAFLVWRSQRRRS